MISASSIEISMLPAWAAIDCNSGVTCVRLAAETVKPTCTVRLPPVSIITGLATAKPSVAGVVTSEPEVPAAVAPNSGMAPAIAGD